MQDNQDRGFSVLIGETIESINAKAINVIKIKTTSGKVLAIHAEERHYGISVLNCEDAIKGGWIEDK